MAADLTNSPDIQPPIISDYDQGGFTIGGAFHKGSVLITGAEGTGFTISNWGIDNPELIDAESLAAIYNTLQLPNLIVLGIGTDMQHPFLKLRAELSKKGVAVEILTTPAACRTWNLLLSEGRKVAFAAVAI